MDKPQYDPQIFNPRDMEDARKISVPDYPEGLNSHERWEKETEFLFERIMAELDLKPGMWVLDYGCGAGRLARKFCEKGIFVLGVELMENMRKYAAEYVNDHQHFLCVSPEMFDELVKSGLRVDGAYSIWCLYHCPDTGAVYKDIRSAMKFNSKFANANLKETRMIPTRTPEFRWIEDNINVWRIADDFFGLCTTIVFPPELDPKNKFLLRIYMRTTVPGGKEDEE